MIASVASEMLAAISIFRGKGTGEDAREDDRMGRGGGRGRRREQQVVRLPDQGSWGQIYMYSILSVDASFRARHINEEKVQYWKAKT